MIILPTPEKDVRQGGYPFAFDRARGLWVAATDLMDDFSWGSFFNPITTWRAATYTATPAARPAAPEDASPLWDAPETVQEEIIAYRGWSYKVRLAEGGTAQVRLESLHNDFFWEGPVATADEVPTADNANGLYAVGLERHHASNFNRYVDGCAVWGRVALSGVVVEGECGYRAERATVQELWVNPEPEDEDEDGHSLTGLCKLLGDRYQCDVSIKAPSWLDLVESARCQP